MTRQDPTPPTGDPDAQAGPHTGPDPVAVAMAFPTPTGAVRLADTRPLVTLTAYDCRECDWGTGHPTEDADTAFSAHLAHHDETRHTRYWRYSVHRDAVDHPAGPSDGPNVRAEQ